MLFGSRSRCQQLFPNKMSFLIFLLYMALFVSQGILITSSRDGSTTYKYNTMLVVFGTECMKLSFSLIAYLSKNSTRSLCSQVTKHSKLMKLYLAPASLYCLYNNLAFVNLANYDPSTYAILLQIRVVITGILFQVLFQKNLSRKQWLALCLLTMGCMMNELHFSKLKAYYVNGNASASSKFIFNINFLLVIVQVLCSCLAGVCNEFLMKNQGHNVDMFLQNIFMHGDSILCNAGVLLWHRQSISSVSVFAQLLHYKIILITLNNAAIGIVTSFFLKYLNSITKSFASALELFFIPILSWIFLNISMRENTILSVIIVSFSIYLYTKSPVPSNSNTTTIINIKPDNSPQVNEQI